jgi:UDP-N-acetylmuramoyl-tripeptide--D-alanyl-D-alanine ligase
LGRLLFDVRRRSFKRPKPTAKIMLIAALAAFLYVASAYLLTAWIASRVTIIYSTDFLILFSLYLLIFNLFQFVCILAAILLVTPLTDYQKRRIMKRARRKMQELKHVRTIGITGSYGKTSTKEFLFSILSSKYKVVKTTGNNNTNMGVAGTILRDVDDSYDFFICEMGAYRIGEIAEICSLALPYAGILTGINQQHIDLFGSIENTKRAKFELIQNLPRDGFAVINRQAQEIALKIDYKVRDVTVFSRDLVEEIKVQPDYIEFAYKENVFRINILGKHYIDNLLAAIIAAEKLGMSISEIQEAVSKIKVESDYLIQKLEGPRGSVFIDDRYSANPTGTIAALEYLEDAYPRCKKILVFPGIVELGKDSENIHQRIWKKADDVCDLVYIVQKDNRVIHNINQIKNEYKKSRFVFNDDFDKIKEDLKKQLDGNTVVLFESRGAGVVLRKLLEDKGK